MYVSRAVRKRVFEVVVNDVTFSKINVNVFRCMSEFLPSAEWGRWRRSYPVFSPYTHKSLTRLGVTLNLNPMTFSGSSLKRFKRNQGNQALGKCPEIR